VSITAVEATVKYLLPMYFTKAVNLQLQANIALRSRKITRQLEKFFYNGMLSPNLVQVTRY
jgi:hypothetical protein